MSENEENGGAEEAEEEINGLIDAEDDEESDVTWEDLVRIAFAFFFTTCF